MWTSNSSDFEFSELKWNPACKEFPKIMRYALRHIKKNFESKDKFYKKYGIER